MEQKTPWRIFHPKVREGGAFFDNACYGSVEGRDGKQSPREAQEKKNHFEDLLLNGCSIEDSSREAGLTIHNEDEKKPLKWVVFNVTHDARLAIIFCEDDRKVVMCRGWVSTHNPRDPLYDADFDYYEQSDEITRKAPFSEL